jgi:hypothetical protein
MVSADSRLSRLPLSTHSGLKGGLSCGSARWSTLTVDTGVGAGSHGHKGWSRLTGTQGLERAHRDTEVGAGSHGHKGWSRLTGTQGLEQAHMDTEVGAGSHGHKRLEQAHSDTEVGAGSLGTGSSRYELKKNPRGHRISDTNINLTRER